MKKSRDSGNLSIDFLAGFTIFIIAFVWVISLVPGLLIDLQAYTIDYDAVAYRTGVILVEDPGVTGSTTGQVPSWEVHENDVARFGLAVSRADPNILSNDKVNRFFDSTEFTYPDDYQNKAVFGSYRFNVSLRYPGTVDPVKYVGNPVNPVSGDDAFGFGYIRRFVKVKTVPSATIDGSNYAPLVSEGYINGDKHNATRRHLVTVLLNNTILTSEVSTVRDPAYQIIPAGESFYVNFSNLGDALWTNDSLNRVSLKNCFDITIRSNDIYISDGTAPNIYVNDIIIKNNDGTDETPVHLTATPLTISDKSIAIPWDSGSGSRDLIDWEAQRITVNTIFVLVPIGECYECPQSDPKFCYGSRFLNSTRTSLGDRPFYFDYDLTRVTSRIAPPQLRDAMLEVAVW